MKGVSVKVPATSANLGPGFDCLGIALDLWNEVKVTHSDKFNITVEGEGMNQVSYTPQNLIVQSAHQVFKYFKKPIPELSFHCYNAIPFARGLGSSAAAAVSGLVAGWALATDSLDIDLQTIFKMASHIDGHPDNISPAIFGGICISYLKSMNEVKAEGDFIIKDISYSKIDYPLKSLKCVIFVGDQELKTSESRSILPQTYTVKDIIFNISRTALLVNSIASGKLEDLKDAMQDKLHQPYRSTWVKHLDGCIKRAIENGAYCAYLSGAGPSIISWCPSTDVKDRDDPALQKIGNSMMQEASNYYVTGRILITDLNFKGLEFQGIY